MSSVRYGTWLGDLKNKQSTERLEKGMQFCLQTQTLEFSIAKFRIMNRQKFSVVWF